MSARHIILVFAAAALCACQTIRPEPRVDTQWAAREDADLASDLAACTDESYGIDLGSSTNYAISRYASAAAMAYQIERGTLRGVDLDDVYRTLRDACMGDRGWVEAEQAVTRQ
jgi:hypothetical protein